MIAVGVAGCADHTKESGARTGIGRVVVSDPAGKPTLADGQPVPTDALIYAAAIAVRPHPEVTKPRIVRVLDHTCDNVIQAGAGACNPQPIPPETRSAVAELLGSTVVFVDDQPSGSDAAAVYVTFGRLKLAAGSVPAAGAELPIAVWCDRMCGQGQTLVLTERDGAWSVTGATGPEWIT